MLHNMMKLTFLFVLQKMTACVMVSVSYKSQRVSNFHSSRSTATKNCLMPSNVNSSLKKRKETNQQLIPGLKVNNQLVAHATRILIVCLKNHV